MSLERELRSLDPPWPPTPDVVTAIAGRLDRGASGVRHPARRPMPAWLRPALAALLALVVAAVAVPPVRAEIGRILGFAGGERIERVDRVPGAAARLDLGRPVGLTEARRRAGFAVLLPSWLEAPDEVLLGGDLGPRAVSLRYGLDTVLTQVPAASSIGVLKQIGGQVELRQVKVGSRFGIWLAPGPRGLVVPVAPGSNVRRRTAVPGAGVLLWDGDRAGYRLETRRGLTTALEIARSIRG